MFEEIAIIGRGGQGAVTAAKLVALAAMFEGYYSQAMPQFGPERRGAVVKAFLRISDKPIRRHSIVRKPTTVVLFDPKIGVGYDGVISGVVNFNGVSNIDLDIRELWAVNATLIAERNGLVSAGWSVLSTPMSGAIVKALEISLSSLEEAVKSEISVKTDANLRAAVEAYNTAELVG